MDAVPTVSPEVTSMTTYIIWLVRIALPIIFFLVWFRTTPEKDTWYSQPHEIVRDKDELMALRQPVGNKDVPESLSTMCLKPDDEIPGFESKPRGGARGNGNKKGTASVGGGVKKRPAAHDMDDLLDDPLTAGEKKDRAIVAAEVKEEEPGLKAEDRADHESLLNFVAFCHKDRSQPIFLPDEERPPPPPRRAEAARRSTRSSDEDDFVEAISLKGREANLRAQSLLKALLHPIVGMKSSLVSRELNRELWEQRVRAAEGTLALMAEACTAAGDLDGASSMLTQMEAEGHCPDNALLDKVMDLYSLRKQKEVATENATIAPIESEAPQVVSPELKAKKPPPWAAASSVSPNFDAFSDDEDLNDMPEPRFDLAGTVGGPRPDGYAVRPGPQSRHR